MLKASMITYTRTSIFITSPTHTPTHPYIHTQVESFKRRIDAEIIEEEEEEEKKNVFYIALHTGILKRVLDGRSS